MVARGRTIPVNYHRLKTVAFSELIHMLHSNGKQTNFILTQKSVYRDSPAGKLDKIRVVMHLRSPLQQRFYSDGERSLSIAVYNHTTSATVQSVVRGKVSIVNCTAVWAPLGGVVSINFFKRHVKHFGVRVEKLSEPCIRYPVDFLSSILAYFTLRGSNILYVRFITGK